MKWVILAVFLAACIRANTEFLSPRRYPPIEMDSVTVFIGAEELQADSIEYERVAMIEYERVTMIFVNGSQSLTDQQGMIKKAREDAAKIGANGIVVSVMVEGSYNAFWGTESPRQGTVIAVRWRVKPAR